MTSVKIKCYQYYDFILTNMANPKITPNKATQEETVTRCEPKQLTIFGGADNFQRADHPKGQHAPFDGFPAFDVHDSEDENLNKITDCIRSGKFTPLIANAIPKVLPYFIDRIRQKAVANTDYIEEIDGE